MLYLIVAGILRQADQVLLVKQQGPDDAYPTWALPGGRVEAGELLTEALEREIREETGIKVERIGSLVYIAQLENTSENQKDSKSFRVSESDQSITFVFEILSWSDDFQSDDPDHLIQEARFLPTAEAIHLLGMLPWPVMAEPAIAYFLGQIDPGEIWLYRSQLGGSETLIARIPGR